MNSETFLKTHRKTWERLNTILGQVAKKGPAGLSQDDLQELGALFRRVTAHLAYAKTYFPGHETNDYLNNLLVKAHGHIYKKETLGMRAVGEFFRRGFPRLVYEQWALISLAGLLLISGLMIGYFLHFFQPSLDGLIIPDNIKRMVGEGLGRGETGADWPLYQRPVISTAIMIFIWETGLKPGLGVTNYRRRENVERRIRFS